MMNRLLSKWPLVVAAVLIALTMSAHAIATGTVRGTVRGPHGPVGGARVVIDSAASSSYTATTRTNPDGTFTFTDAPVGAVGLKAYDADDKVIATGKAVLQQAGDTISVLLNAAH